MDVPWLETITLNYVKPDMCFNVKTTTDNVLEYYNDEISAESFISALEVTECSGEDGWEDVDLDDITTAPPGLVCSEDPKQAYQEFIKSEERMKALLKEVYIL